MERPRVPLVTAAVLPASRLDLEAVAGQISTGVSGTGSESGAGAGAGAGAGKKIPHQPLSSVSQWGPGLVDPSMDATVAQLEPGEDKRFWQDELLTSAMASGILRSHGDTVRAATQSGVAVVPRGYHLSVRRSLGAMVGAARRHMESSRGGAQGLIRAAGYLGSLQSREEGEGQSGSEYRGGGDEGCEDGDEGGDTEVPPPIPPVVDRSSDWLEHVFRRDGSSLGLLG